MFLLSHDRNSEVAYFLFQEKGLSLLDLPGVPKSRFKELLIREVRNVETKEKQSRNNKSETKQSPDSSSRDIHNNLIRCDYCRKEGPHSGGEW